MIYLWLKALHVLSIIAWMAAILYLPRLFVYHAEAGAGSPQAATFIVMERRLLKAIMTPAMIAAWITGLWLAWEAGFLKAGWLHAKLALVVLMSGMHGYLAKAQKDFAAGRNTRPPRWWRMVNEVPTLLLIGIVILVIVKPF